MRECNKLKDLLSNVGENESVYARQTTYVQKGQTKLTYKYIAGTEEEIWELIQNGTNTICEVIDARKPCHLYIDIDVDRKKYPNIKAFDCWNDVKPLIENHFESLCGKGSYRFIVMDSSSEKKGSLHIVVKVKNCLFKTAAHCGAYMRILYQVIKDEHPAKQGAFSFFDLGIYTRNRLFRMAYQTKATEQRYLEIVGSMEDPNFDSWKDARVCPVNSGTVKLMTPTEPDGTEARFSSRFSSSSATVVSGWVPPCVRGSICDFLSSEYGNIERMIYTGMNMRVVCNTNRKDCILAKRKHKSNVMYVVINLIQKTYHLKCHSRHCKNKRSKTFQFNEDHTNLIDDWLNMSMGSSPL